MNLLYIYDLNQATWMANNGAKIYRIGKGARGDVLITFEKTGLVLQLLKYWQEHDDLMKIR